METITVDILNGTDASVRRCSDIHFADLPYKPAPTFRVAIFLEGVFAVEVVHPNLTRYPSTRVLEIWRPTYLFPALPDDRSQRGERNSVENGRIMSASPLGTRVHALNNGATGHLVEDSHRPDPRAHSGDAAPSDSSTDTAENNGIITVAARFTLEGG